jgi:hypothetical protein
MCLQMARRMSFRYQKTLSVIKTEILELEYVLVRHGEAERKNNIGVVQSSPNRISLTFSCRRELNMDNRSHYRDGAQLGLRQ